MVPAELSSPLTADWRFREADEAPAPGLLADVVERLSISPLLARLLLKRTRKAGSLSEAQLTAPRLDPALVAELDAFLAPNLRHLAPPEEIPGLTEAAEVLATGLRAGKRFAVWGDYDVDGVTSSALVHQVLTERGIPVRTYLPTRLTEGYGLNTAGIRTLAEEGVELLLTVDCGISDIEAVALAKELGMTVVVSDHHLPGEVLPAADALCNPKCGDCTCRPVLQLAGVGVAFYLMAALNRLLDEAAFGPKVDMRAVLDLVALGTIADVVDLNGANRALAKNGLLMLAEARRPGIAALKRVSGYDRTAQLTAGQVAFGLAPRINAAGRLGKPQTALDLLLATTEQEAKPLAESLDAANTERRAEEERITEAALTQATEQEALGRMGLVLAGEDWHPGVIGIVASRVVEATNKPTLVCGLTGEENTVYKGSGRSIREFDLYQGLCACADHFLTFGGHTLAAGCSFAAEELNALRETFHQAVVAACGPDPVPPALYLDEELPFPAVTLTLLKELELLQPFGMGNPEPTFASPPVVVKKRRTFGKNHVSLELRDEAAGITLKAKGFRMAESIPEALVGQTIQIAFRPTLDTYNGLASIDLKIKDWRFVQTTD